MAAFVHLSGGQMSMQVDGTLAVQSNALPRLSVEVASCGS